MYLTVEKEKKFDNYIATFSIFNKTALPSANQQKGDLL